MEQKINIQEPPDPPKTSWAGSLCTVLSKGIVVVHHVVHPMMIVAGIMSRCEAEAGNDDNSITILVKSDKSIELAENVQDEESSKGFSKNGSEGESGQNESMDDHPARPLPLREVLVFDIDWDDRNDDDVVSLLSDEDFDTSFGNALENEPKKAICMMVTLCASTAYSLPGHTPIHLQDAVNE